ncbi:arylesterase [Novosphingobium album (ex Liu et al. 2023)]|uniref:Arylesterase n=1 Tax=Novosphingobium album (ex Liu et al. 2023) TaxID=3031130 RepID=A0ABT5WLX1_9SPHN|nr:arylesterase [Novosphingobium album (ex Liu et al. 2023)]MDE8650879.1 arylesterase [Novosphingobium album (ex Liu et al. 2023)]
MQSVRFAALAALALLSACDRAAPPAPAETQSAVDAPPAIPVMGPERPILAFGDSLLAGYGLKDGESYPARLEAALRARGINARIANAGVSGDTTAAGLQRLDFTLNSQTARPELVIISLGGNDMLRGLPPAETRANLEQILARLREEKIPAMLLGMLAAPNLGKDYAAKFNPIYPTLATKYGAVLVPFFLQPVIDKPDLIQPDHVHPTALGIDEIVAATVDDVADALPKVPKAPNTPNPPKP